MRMRITWVSALGICHKDQTRLTPPQSTLGGDSEIVIYNNVTVMLPSRRAIDLKPLSALQGA